MTISGTGHRLGVKLGGYDPRIKTLLYTFAADCLRAYEPDSLITGMAQGWDMALAQAAVDLHIPFTAAVPWPGQALRWPDDARREWETLLSFASTVHYTSRVLHHPDSVAGVMFRRNQWMVDQLFPIALGSRTEAQWLEGADLVLALWNKESGGGTAHCVNYAKATGRAVVNVWDAWQARVMAEDGFMDVLRLFRTQKAG